MPLLMPLKGKRGTAETAGPQVGRKSKAKKNATALKAAVKRRVKRGTVALRSEQALHADAALHALHADAPH